MEIVLSVEKGYVPHFPDVSFVQGVYLFGSEEGSDFLLSGGGISQSHCLLRVGSHSVYILDLNSSTGSFVNDSRVTGKWELGHGDLLRIGDYILRVHIGPLPPAIDLVTAMTNGPKACEPINFPRSRQ